MTIDVVNLNDRERLVKKRFDIGVKLCDELEDLLEMATEYDNGKSDFSATAATVILHEESYSQIKQLFINLNLWNNELIDLEKEVAFCALDV